MRQYKHLGSTCKHFGGQRSTTLRVFFR